MLVSFAMAQNYSIEFSQKKSATDVVTNNYNNLEIEYSYPGITSFDVKTKKGEFSEIAIPNTFSIGAIGSPKLPASKNLIEVPFGADVSVEVISFETTTYNLKDYGINKKLIPNQPSVSKSDDPAAVKFEYDEAAYASKSFSKNEIATVEVLGTLRGIRLARVVVAPVRYNPSSDEIIVYNNIKVNVTFANSDVAQTEYTKAATYSPYFDYIYKQAINYRSTPDDYPNHPDLTTYPIKYLVISDRMFEDQLQEFIDWKTKQGFEMIVSYTDEIGTSYSDIQSYIHGQYNAGTPEDPAPSFILFVGDYQQIPMQRGNASNEMTDLYYASVDGDYFPEMYYGRFSAQTTAQLQPQIDKTLYYEKYEFESPEYLDRVTLIAGEDGTWNPNVGQPTIQYGTENYFNAEHGYSTVNDYLTNYTGCYETVDEGVGFINYTAHCSPTSWATPNLTINDVNNFVNDKMYPLAVGNCCQSNQLEVNECIGETWMRKANGGSVAYIGSAPSTYWFEDFYWSVGAFPIQGNNNGYVPTVEETTLGAYDAMFMGDYKCGDATVFVGNLSVTEVDIQGYPQHSTPLYYWQAYSFNGDPSIMLYNTQGIENNVSHMAIVPIGVDFYEVTADPGSYVGISKDGVLHGAALVGDEGVVNVPLDPILSGGDVTIVVTGRQRIPYIATVPAAALEGPYLVLDNTVVADAAGNNNGQADFGEAITLDVTVKNVGADPATGVVATVNGTDEFITIYGANTADFGDIANGESSTIEDAYAFNVADNVADEYTATYELEMTAGTDSWTSNMTIKAYAPVLAVGTYVIDDSESGNNNGRLDPGETANILVTAMNNGHADAPNCAATFSTTSDVVTVTSGAASLGTITASGEAVATFTVVVDDDATVGSSAVFAFEVVSGNYSADKNITLNIGLILEDFESGTLDAFAWELSGDAEWFVQDAVAQEGVYAAVSGDINDNQQSVLSIEGNVVADGTISFYRKVSSEGSYDKLRFFIDDAEQEFWSGDLDWEQVEFGVTAGEHTFTWKYTKDGSQNGGEDCAWIDYIVFPTMEMATGPLAMNVTAGTTELCAGSSTELHANVTGGTGTYSINWTPIFGLDDPTSANPVATPLGTTTYTCTVDDGDNTMSGEIEIVVNPVPETPTITQEGTSLVSSATEGNQWYNEEGAVSGATEQTFTPANTGTYYVVVSNEFGCDSDDSNAIYFGFTGIDNMGSKEIAIYPNPFNNTTTIAYYMRSNNSLSIDIFSSIGEHVMNVVNASELNIGNHKFVVSGADMREGVYYVVFSTKETKTTRKLVLVK